MLVIEPRKSLLLSCILIELYNEVANFRWKDLNNPFRLDKQTNLQVIPTLIKWGGPQRLEGEHLEKVELVEMLFTDEDD